MKQMNMDKRGGRGRGCFSLITLKKIDMYFYLTKYSASRTTTST